MHLQRIEPDPRLARHVRCYRARLADLGPRTVRRPLPARADVILEFYFATPHLVEVQRTGERERAPLAVVVGPQTHRRVDLILSGRMDVFTVAFEPTGLHALFRLPMSQLTDVALEADHLFSPLEAQSLYQQLAEAPDLAARAQIMDGALLQRLATLPPDPIALAVQRIQRDPVSAAIPALAAGAGLSERQFRRAFEARVGMAPKLYARILRLNAALEAKAAAPATSWTEIAHQFGWFDHAHLDKDFLALAGASPSRFVTGGGA
jgi:AraC-like DNA-binding protein